MAVRDSTNSLLVELMAFATDIGEPKGKQLRELVGRLSKAAQTERAKSERLEGESAAQEDTIKDLQRKLEHMKSSLDSTKVTATEPNISRRHVQKTTTHGTEEPGSSMGIGTIMSPVLEPGE